MSAITFIDFANRLSPLSEEAKIDLMASISTKTYPKGSLLLKEGDTCRHLYFIQEGLVKLCFNKEDKEFIMRFFPEGALFTLLDSYLNQLPATYEIIALEATTVTMIRNTAMDALCRKHHTIETFFRKLISTAALNMMDRVSELLEENATTRYAHFVAGNSALLQRISLGDLANYLGITQVSLSRIRAKK